MAERTARFLRNSWEFLGIPEGFPRDSEGICRGILKAFAKHEMPANEETNQLIGHMEYVFQKECMFAPETATFLNCDDLDRHCALLRTLAVGAVDKNRSEAYIA